jgi:hypothetical protein
MGRFKINRWRHYKWFFNFIWWCIKDFFQTPADCFNEIGLWKENWEDFNTRLYFDTDPEALETTRRLNELFKNDKNN